MEAISQLKIPMKAPENAGVTTVELITPGAALAMLELNLYNRSVCDERVSEFARLIDSDRFLLTHQGIALAVDGSVLDGQHRLWAIVKAGKAVWIRVTRGLPRDVRWAVDIGRPRKVADEIDILNAKRCGETTKDGNKLQAMASVLASFVEGFFASTLVDTMKIVDTLRPGMEFVLDAGTHRKLTTAPVRAAVALAHKAHPALVESFYRSYISGAGLDQGSPIMALRNLALLGGGGARSDWTRKRKLFQCTLRCIEAYLLDESLKVPRPSASSLDRFLKSNGLKAKLRSGSDE